MRRFLFNQKNIVFVIFSAISLQVFAAESLLVQEDFRDQLKNFSDTTGSGYFQVNDQVDGAYIDLMDFDAFGGAWPTPSVPYNRDKQFGGWIRDKSGETCLNTRGLVLIRDSKAQVTFSANGCTVQDGRWNDPYTSQNFSSSRDIQIDHFVPLKNAYISGAYEWTNQKRCLYSNYIENDIHLLSVLGKENQRKSDKTPEGYMPPAADFKCQYLKNWLVLKLIWKLRLTSNEKTFITSEAKRNGCHTSDMQVEPEFIEQQRNFISNQPNYCNP